MRWNHARPWLALLALAAGFGPLAAQPPHEPDPALARLVTEVQGLNRTLGQMAGLLERVAEQQQVDLLLKRLEVKERRLAPLASRVRGAESEVQALNDEVQRIELMREQVRELQLESTRSGESAPPEAQREIQELDLQLKLMRGRVEEAQLRLRGLEDDLARREEEIKILDEMLLEKFE